MIASLAVANRPDALTFVLVDYKGGSAFKDCAFLPHTVGMVTDLDAHLVERALTSLGAELRAPRAPARRRRRQGHRRLPRPAEPRAGPARRCPGCCSSSTSSPRMARELPDFVTGLVDIAQRGRSLGIHLRARDPAARAASCRPEIRANTNLRISLRVTDGADEPRRHRRAGRGADPEVARRAAATPGSGTPRWCRSRPPGSAAGGPGRRAVAARRPVRRRR